MTPTKRKRREWLPALFIFIGCVFICSWRIVLYSEPDLIAEGTKAGLFGQSGHLNSLDEVKNRFGHDRYPTGNGDIEGTKSLVYTRHLEVKGRCDDFQATNDPFNDEDKKQRFPFPPYISYEPKTFFCPLPKAGSTFFTRRIQISVGLLLMDPVKERYSGLIVGASVSNRYFLTVKKAHDDPYISPLNFSIESASRFKQMPFSILKSKEDRDNFIAESTKVVFTRHPYARLFSAYVDKLFAPNPMFWRMWGLNAIRFNKDLSISDHPCGSFVSFPDFIKLVLKGLYKRDPHIMPMDHLCKFCEVNYDVIGKLENIMTDVDFLSSKLNISGTFIHDKNFKDYFTEDAVKDSTKDALTTWRQEVSQCISDFEVGRLIWRKLQIRGFIDASIAFPFTPKEMEGISLEDFREECYFAVDNSNDKEKLKSQKQVAYQEAFSLIPDEALIALQKIYQNDFSLLEYDDKRPVEFVPGRTQNAIKSLDWRKTWLM